MGLHQEVWAAHTPALYAFNENNLHFLKNPLSWGNPVYTQMVSTVK